MNKRKKLLISFLKFVFLPFYFITNKYQIMIYEQQKSSVNTVGEIKSNSVKIKEENLDFILTILSSNLYSDPISSLIREYCSNALDSHREAKVDEPILVEFKKDINDNWYFLVQDFGVGISKERFYDIFINLASSTKRNSNEFIGMWGLGRLSGLSYTNQISITSIYNGIKTIYIMYKDGTKINIDETLSIKTDERNGVTIKINVKDNDVDEFKNKIPRELQFFSSIYLDIDESLDNKHYPIGRFNYFKIKDNKYYKISTLNPFESYTNSIKTRILLGEVTYPLEIDKLKDKNIVDNRYDIYLKFDIGELEVIPNRENLLYSEKTIKAIEKRYWEAINELQKDYKDLWKKDFSNPFVYYSYIYNYKYGKKTLLKDELGYEVRVSSFEKYDFTLLGEKLNEKTFEYILDNTYRKLIEQFFITNYYHIFDIIGNVKKISNLYNPLSDILSKKDYICCDYSSLSLKEKTYFKNNYNKNERVIFEIKNVDSFNKFVFSLARQIVKCNKWNKETREIFRCLVKSTIQMYNDLKKFNKEDVPKDFKIIKENTPKKVIDKENITINKVRFKEYGSGVTSDRDSVNFDSYKKDQNKIVIWSGQEDKDKLLNLYNFLCESSWEKRTFISDKYSFIWVTSRFEELLKNEPEDKFINYNSFMNEKNELIVNIGTLVYIHKTFPFLENLSKIEEIKLWNEELYDILKEYEELSKKYSFCFYNDSPMKKQLKEEIYNICKDNNSWNNEIKDKFDSKSTLLNNARCLQIFTFNSFYSWSIKEEMKNIITDYILSKNLFPVKQEMIDKLNKETIFNIKN